MFKKVHPVLIISFVAMLIVGNGYSQSPTKSVEKKEEKYHFRKARFGMSMAEVKKLEETELVSEDENIIRYKDTVLNKSVHVSYQFVNNQFFRGTYLIKEEYLNENKYIADFEKFKKALLEKYGKPIHDMIEWKNRLYKSDPEKHGFAIGMGHLEYYTLWRKWLRKQSETEIEIWLFGENFDITHRIQYRDVLLSEVYKEQQKEKENSKL